MYADQVATGRKLSVKDRLQGSAGTSSGSGRQFAGVKRQRAEDSKWKHDLYMDAEGPRSSRPRLGDLRLKLQRSGSDRSQRGGRNPGDVRDLREKLSGPMQPPAGNSQAPLKLSKAVPAAATVSSVTKTARNGPQPPAQSAVETKKVVGSGPTPSLAVTKKKTTQQKAEESVDQFLKSLGLDKYLITFQAEEVDMAALVHMTDEDLRALGIPMGPRKKIRLALDSRRS
ncbi:sterile alpha motif (SAM) domain-containing protein [Wolffia australiana]